MPQPEERARGTVLSFLASCARESRERAAELLTGLARGPFLAADTTEIACADALGIGPPLGEPPSVAFGDAEVHEVMLDGDVGSVRLRSGGGEDARVELEDVGGTWLIVGPG